MLNCCEGRVAVRVPRGKRGKWNRSRVLDIIDKSFIVRIVMNYSVNVLDILKNWCI
jgi:hypothetical protein